MTCEKAYITVLGRSAWAMVNCYYAVLRDEKYHPDEIYIFTEKSFESNLESGTEGMEVLNKQYGISPKMNSIVVDDGDFLSSGKEISDTVKRLKDMGCQIALDITPGRKPLVTGALIPAMKHELEHIYYLAISDLDDVAKPYMEIPFGKHKLWDFSRQVIK